MFIVEGRRATAGNTRASAGCANPRRWRLLLGVLAALALSIAALAPTAAQAEEPAGSEVTEWACDHVTVRFFNFPNLPNNVVHIKVTIDGVQQSYTYHTFNGSEAIITQPVAVPPGKHKIDVFTKWKTNGVKGSRDEFLQGGITCEADPEFEIVKKQRRGGKGA